MGKTFKKQKDSKKANLQKQKVKKYFRDEDEFSSPYENKIRNDNKKRL
jgi:hypothetical protein